MRSDLVVVGAGAAGLFAALTAAREGARVTLVSARPLAETASYWAQGGAAAALAVDDSPAIHLEDTLEAGRGLTKRSAAVTLTDEAAARVRELIDLGCQFDADRHGDLALGLEGGHSRRRIIHAGGSATGRRILRALSAAAAEHPLIQILEGERVAGLLEGGGVVLRSGGEPIQAKATLLATGGAAALWSRTTNPPGSFGSGLILARAAGAQLADLEFTQFHPTAVVGLPGREGFLISEAVRGEGATLHDQHGERFVDELKPRDHVSRAIFNLPGQTALLDMTAVDPERFPNIVEALQQAGLDPTTQRIPVAPASHYVMGGIVTDLDGRALPRLYAVGECACTGLHGANRLASNSLSECFVFGRRAALAALDDAPPDRRSDDRGGRPSAQPRDPRGRVAARRPRTQRGEPHAPAAGSVPARPPGRRQRPASPGNARCPRPRRVPGHGPRPRRPPHGPGRAHRDPALRGMDGLLIDWGGVLTTNVFDAFTAFSQREGLAAEAVLDMFRHEPHLVDLESGTIDLHEFERRVAATLDVAPDGLAKRLMADVEPDVEMRRAVKRYHDAGIKTALVSNSWNEDDYDVDLHAMFDVVVLSQALKIRKPATEIFEVALERLQLPAPACVFVDDLGGNLKAAQRLGLTTIKHERTETTVRALDRLLLDRAS